MDAMIITLLFLFIFTTVSSYPPSNFTLYGTAHINQTTITLTHPLPNCTSPPPYPNTGRIFHKTPIQFLDSTFNTTLSFSTKFSFTIIPPSPPCLPGEGLTFLITSYTNSLPYSVGSIGLPESLTHTPLHSSSFLAVEFDTNYDQRFNDINDNHVGIDLDSIFSKASVDLMSIGIDLKKGGNSVSSWVEYNSSKKVIEIWVGYRDTKPDTPVLTAPIDISKRFNPFMYVGFSASNGDGSSVHLINNWEFRTFESGSSGSMYPDMEIEQVGLEDCLICFPDPHKETRPETEPGLTKNNHTKGLKLAIALLVVNLILVILTLCGVVLYLCNLTKKSQHQPKQTLIRTFQTTTNSTNKLPRRLKLSEIRSATIGFNRNLIIGDGVSSVVYKTDQNLAVKRFKTASFGSQIATEFVRMVSSLHHRNLMKLQAWCCERNELILVYDYMPNGSLDKIVQNVRNVHNRTVTGEILSFEARLNVLIGVSSALVYLHEECDRIIVHRNVKTSNILLDLDLVPKLGDFGTEYVYSRVPARAMGYLAPEYVYSRVPTVKTDVYSFGVVVLEVVTGKPAVDDGKGVMVTDWVWDLWEEKRLVAAADGSLGGEFDRREVEMVLMVGLSCVHPNYQIRPTMKEVMRMLKGEMVPNVPEVKPTVVVQSGVAVRSPEVVVKCGGDDNMTSWGTPTSHFSKV